MAVYQLPKKSQAPLEAHKPIKGSPDSLYYAIIRSQSGNFQVVTKDGGVCQYQSPQKAFCLEWILENDTNLSFLVA